MKTLTICILLVIGISVYSQDIRISSPVVMQPVYFDVSPPLRDMANLKIKADISWKDGIVQNHFNIRRNKENEINHGEFIDKGLQDVNGPLSSDSTIQNFEGMGSTGYIPPDPYGDVGPDDYFQVVNASYSIYNKTGVKILGPLANSSVWNGMPNNVNSGDAVVVYDENANRWLFSQFSLPNYPYGPFFQMIAVSQTPDPTGSWYRYQYSFTAMPDYPKFGVWPDGYYMTCNRFSAGGGNYAGTGAAAYDRAAMLVGNPNAQMIWFTLPASNEAFGMLPSDCDGPFPPIGTPAYYAYEYDASPYHLGILEFHADWVTPSNSTFGNLLTLPVNSFNSSIPGGIPQKGTNIKLATLSDRLMYRLQFRLFSDHWSMVTNHTVNVGSNIAGIRWYELRKTTGAWNINQQSTYAPADNNCRWMGSIAMDTAGNMALGYSISSSTLYPSIRYTGRLKTDPISTMTITEQTIANGGGSQTSSSQRWGDYSSMTVDPSNPTTFWYTTEYYTVTSSSDWHTRIASFTFSNIFSSYATSDPEITCGGDSSQLKCVSYGGSGNYTYSWTSLPPGFTSTLKDPKVAPMDTTTYIVAVNDGTSTMHDTAIVNAVPPATAFAGNDTTVCIKSLTIQLHGIATNYKLIGWTTTGNGTFDNKFIADPIYTFGSQDKAADSVNLDFIAFSKNPCTGSVASVRQIKFDPCTGIADPAGNEVSLEVRPNPASGSVLIILNGSDNTESTLTLSDIKGTTVYSVKLKPEESGIGKVIGLQGFPFGIYFLKYSSINHVIVKRLVVN